MLDYADLIALNKSDKRGALDAIQAVRKQFQRNHQLWENHWKKCQFFLRRQVSLTIGELRFVQCID